MPSPSLAPVGPVLQALSVAIVGVLPAFLVGALPVIELRRRHDQPDLSAPARVLTALRPPLAGPVPTALHGRS